MEAGIIILIFSLVVVIVSAFIHESGEASFAYIISLFTIFILLMGGMILHEAILNNTITNIGNGSKKVVIESVTTDAKGDTTDIRYKLIEVK